MAYKFNLDGFSVDENDVCTADGGFVGDITGSVTAGTTTTYEADGAISITDDIAELNGFPASCQMTLANPTKGGQRIIIVCFDATNTCDVDAAYYTGDSTGTFSTGNSLELVSILSGADSNYYWMVVGNQGVVFS